MITELVCPNDARLRVTSPKGDMRRVRGWDSAMDPRVNVRSIVSGFPCDCD